MLLVFLLAACLAITLYTEMPRVAFEAERQKELLLVDRGNQFKRAIGLFETDRTNNPMMRYPASIDELLSFNNHRYLRRKYVDPMTGKDEWRIVHTNGMTLTDSVTTQAPNQNNQSASTGSNYIMTTPGLDAGSGQPQGGANAAMRRRPSDATGPPGSTDSGGGQGAGGSPGMPGNAGGPGAIGQPPNMGVVTPGAIITPSGGAGQPAQTCTSYIGGCAPTTPGQPGGRGILPGQPGNPVSSQTGGVSPYGLQPGLPGGQPGLPGQPGLGMNPDAQSAGAAMIGQILTSPRPGGMPTGQPGTVVGGGMAGVASKFEAEGIMVINERTTINEWEFIFDKTKWRIPPNPIGGGPGSPMGSGPAGTTGPGGGNSGFSNPNPGGATGFGSTGTGGGRGQ